MSHFSHISNIAITDLLPMPDENIKPQWCCRAQIHVVWFWKTLVGVLDVAPVSRSCLWLHRSAVILFTFIFFIFLLLEVTSGEFLMSKPMKTHECRESLFFCKNTQNKGSPWSHSRVIVCFVIGLHILYITVLQRSLCCPWSGVGVGLSHRKKTHQEPQILFEN